MKLRHLLLCALPVLVGASCKSDSSRAWKKEFISSCMATAQQTGGASVSQELLKESCECSADRVASQLSEEELQALKNSDAAMQARISELTKPCIEELQQKMAKGETR